jgi:type II secretory pathway pseudopilin PulG
MANRRPIDSPVYDENAMGALRFIRLNARTAHLGRRAVTLLELLIAIALVLAMLALVGANLMAQLDERRFDSTGDVLLQHLLLARAHAQSTGGTVEVLYIPGAQAGLGGDGDGPRIESRSAQQKPIDRWPEEGSAGMPALDGSDAASGSVADSEAGADGASPDQTKIYESWASQDLPAGYRVLDQPPADASALTAAAMIAGDTFELSGDPASPTGEAPRSIRLALFLPDGSAIVSDARWLIDDGSRLAKITINPWTGLPAIERVKEDDQTETPVESDDQQEGGVRDRSASSSDRDGERESTGALDDDGSSTTTDDTQDRP